MTDPADPTAAMLRTTTLTAAPGHRRAMIDAAWRNAEAAREAPGCLSAEVYTEPSDPETVHVVSRWQRADDLSAFLAWHKGIAHESLADHTVAAPTSVHREIAPRA